MQRANVTVRWLSNRRWLRLHLIGYGRGEEGLGLWSAETYTLVMKDRIIVAVSRDGHLRVRAAATTDVVSQALTRHVPGRLAAEALARALSAAAVYPVSWKDTERVSIQWSGAGPLGTLLTELRDPGHLRGFVTQPGAKIDRTWQGWRGIGHGLLPNGFISVVRQDHRGTFTQSQVELKNGEVDEDLEGFFEKSEQIPTRVRALVRLVPEELTVRAAGVLVQSMPGSEAMHLPGRRLHERLDPASDPMELISETLGGRPFEVLDEIPLQFACPCSRERIESGIGLLGPEELRQMIDEDQGARARCDFCATTYVLSGDDLRALLDRKLAG